MIKLLDIKTFLRFHNNHRRSYIGGLDELIYDFFEELKIRKIQYINGIPILDYTEGDSITRKISNNSFVCFWNYSKSRKNLRENIFNQIFYWASDVPNNHIALSHLIKKYKIQPFIADGSNPIENIEYLVLEHNVDINEDCTISQARDNIDLVSNPQHHIKKLIELGADPNLTDEEGNTPLVKFTFVEGGIHYILMMIDKGADVFIKNLKDKMMLHIIFEEDYLTYSIIEEYLSLKTSEV